MDRLRNNNRLFYIQRVWHDMDYNEPCRIWFNTILNTPRLIKTVIDVYASDKGFRETEYIMESFTRSTNIEEYFSLGSVTPLQLNTEYSEATFVEVTDVPITAREYKSYICSEFLFDNFIEGDLIRTYNLIGDYHDQVNKRK